MTIGTNDVHRFNRIGGIPGGEKFNIQIVFSLINMPFMVIKMHVTDTEVYIW